MTGVTHSDLNPEMVLCSFFFGLTQGTQIKSLSALQENSLNEYSDSD